MCRGGWQVQSVWSMDLFKKTMWAEQGGERESHSWGGHYRKSGQQALVSWGSRKPVGVKPKARSGVRAGQASAITTSTWLPLCARGAGSFGAEQAGTLSRSSGCCHVGTRQWDIPGWD